MGKNLSNNMIKNFSIVLKSSTTDAIKATSKRSIQKTAETTNDFIGTKIADKVTRASEKSPTRSQKW